MTDFYFKTIAATCAVIGSVFGAQNLTQRCRAKKAAEKKRISDELRNHNDKLLVHEEEIATQKEDLEEMKANFQKSFEDLGDDISKIGATVGARVEKIEDKNREDHRLLFESLNSIGNAVSETNGYLRAKNEKNN